MGQMCCSSRACIAQMLNASHIPVLWRCADNGFPSFIFVFNFWWWCFQCF